MKTFFVFCTTLVSVVTSLQPAVAAEVIIQAAKDNTLYEDASGSISNGAGEFLFAGRVGATGGSDLRRIVIAFDVAGAVPPGSSITNASLRMNMSKSNSGAIAVSIHKASADWGEGTSDATFEEGQGAAATTGDATWTKRFFGTTSDWSTPGGDYAAVASAVSSVNLPGPYTWNSPELLTDVTSWYTAPATNFGWVIRGDEAITGSAKRFDSRQNATSANRPTLTVTYNPPSVVRDWNIY